jgi:hypothetical protein
MRHESDSSDETPRERRRTVRRRRIEEHGIKDARVRPGTDAVVIDVSAGGALIETRHRMLPGAAIELQLASGSGRVAVRGSVVRCSVARVRAGGIWYRGAIAFDRHLPWFVEGENDGDAVPAAEMRRGRHRREDAIPPVL